MTRPIFITTNFEAPLILLSLHFFSGIKSSTCLSQFRARQRKMNGHSAPRGIARIPLELQRLHEVKDLTRVIEGSANAEARIHFHFYRQRINLRICVF